MAHNTPYHLSEAVSIPVLVIWVAEFMFMIHQTGIIPGNTGAVQAPIMPCVPALNRYIKDIEQDDIKIF